MAVGGNNLNGFAAHELRELAGHIHNGEHWLGISADQSGNDWAVLRITPFRAISGANAYGADADDEAKVIGTDDVPVTAGNVKYDLHRILFAALSTDSPWIIRIVYGTGTMADAVIAEQFSEVMVQNNPAGNKANGAPVPIMMPRLTSGTDKVWVQAWNATNNATADFYVGLHEYTE